MFFITNSLLQIALVIVGLWAFITFVAENFLDKYNALNWRWPLLGEIPTFAAHLPNLLDFTVAMHRKRNVGWIRVKIGSSYFVGVVDPIDVKHILKDNWKNYAVSTGMRGEVMRELLGDGIFNADGNHWFLQRKHASREFSTNIFRNFMSAEFVLTTHKLCAKLHEQIGQTVDLHQLFFAFTLDTFGKIAYGVDIGGLSGKPIPFASAFDRTLEILTLRVCGKPEFWWKFQRWLNFGEEKELKEHLQTISCFVYGVIEDRRAAHESLVEAEKHDQFLHALPSTEEENNLLTKLIAACESDASVPFEQREKYLRDMTVNFIFAGRDTTACALSWLFYELMKHPNVEQALLIELENVLQGRVPTFDLLNECHFLTACLSETLRLHPPIPDDPKTAIADDVLPCGVKIKKGDSVSYTPYVMGRREALWGRDAEQFRPTRWLNERNEFVREDPFKFTAFQAGPRMCLGMDMAMLEMKIVVAILLPVTKFELMEEPQHRMSLVMQMKNGLQARVSQRQKVVI